MKTFDGFTHHELTDEEHQGFGKYFEHFMGEGRKREPIPDKEFLIDRLEASGLAFKLRQLAPDDMGKALYLLEQNRADWKQGQKNRHLPFKEQMAHMRASEARQIIASTLQQKRTDVERDLTLLNDIENALETFLAGRKV